MSYNDVSILVYRIGLTGDDSSFYPFWVTSVLGPILFIAAVAHAVLWGFPGSIVGSIVSTLYKIIDNSI